eukprot:1585420-Prymnesium_polylepis.1
MAAGCAAAWSAARVRALRESAPGPPPHSDVASTKVAKPGCSPAASPMASLTVCQLLRLHIG